MKESYKLTNLISSLSESIPENYANILHSVVFSSEDLRPFETWDQDGYTRNCLYRSEKFELILICWNGRQKTSVHCHGGEKCWITLLDGELREIHFHKDHKTGISRVGSRVLKKNDHSYIDDRLGLHQLENASDHRAISLHLYAKPIDECSVFDENRGQFFRKRMAYDNSTAFIHTNDVMVN